MLFNSPAFLLFFPVVTIVFFLLQHKWRWLWLLAASCYFYMFFRPIYILILFFTIAVDYTAGILIENSNDKKHRKLWLVASLLANIGVLIFFKYINFFGQTWYDLTGLGSATNGPLLNIILPVGLSFHTFQAMSYTIEVYRGNQKAERHAGIYALYVMFYPQLVAGPIERPGHMLPQLHKEQHFDYDKVSKGLRRMLWGFFKKLVIADRLSFFVNMVYAQPHQYTGWPLIWAILFFSFQIYADFSGYCDIAIGAANVMGFDLMENFKLPYFSSSVGEFWKRWHISLSSWFRDYVYIPFGGNRNGNSKWTFNILLVFAISGLWHGAAWTYVIWGILHAIFIIVEKMAGRYIRLPQMLSIVLTFIVVTLAWVFFRAESVNDAWYILSHLRPSIDNLIGLPLISSTSFVLSFLLTALMITTELIQVKQNELGISVAKKPILRYVMTYGLIMLIIIFGIFEEQTFIYFQF